MNSAAHTLTAWMAARGSDNGSISNFGGEVAFPLNVTQLLVETTQFVYLDIIFLGASSFRVWFAGLAKSQAVALSLQLKE